MSNQKSKQTNPTAGMVSAVEVCDTNLVSTTRVVFYHQSFRVKHNCYITARLCDLPSIVYMLFDLHKQTHIRSLMYVQLWIRSGGSSHSKRLEFFYPVEYSLAWDAMVSYTKGGRS